MTSKDENVYTNNSQNVLSHPHISNHHLPTMVGHLWLVNGILSCFKNFKYSLQYINMICCSCNDGYILLIRIENRCMFNAYAVSAAEMFLIGTSFSKIPHYF